MFFYLVICLIIGCQDPYHYVSTWDSQVPLSFIQNNDGKRVMRDYGDINGVNLQQ